MKRKFILTLAALAVLTTTLCSCGTSDTSESQTAADTAASTEAAAVKEDPTIAVPSALSAADGYTTYTSPDNSFSIQLPEGTTIDDSTENNVTITLSGEFETPDLINISKSDNAQRITTTAELMKMLENDNSIDITAFYKLAANGEYTGYKYCYDSIDNPSLKGIVSTYFTADGTAYVVNATINNGADEANFGKIFYIIDTFNNAL